MLLRSGGTLRHKVSIHVHMTENQQLQSYIDAGMIHRSPPSANILLERV
jgi:hypothetical protein